jgi:PhnB protein
MAKAMKKGKMKAMKAKAKAKKKVLAVPLAYTKAVPYLTIKGAAAALEFYKKAFGAKELARMAIPGSPLIGHSEIKIGESRIMMADEMPNMGSAAPTSAGSPVTIMMYVKDVDGFCERAVAAGATLRRPVETMFYGDRMGSLQDPFGHSWMIATHVEEVSTKEMMKRMAAMPMPGASS